MISENQFEKLIETFSMAQQDRERMIRIEAITELNHKHIIESLNTFSAALSKTEALAKASHRRMDYCVAFGAGITGMIAVVGFILKLTNKI